MKKFFAALMTLTFIMVLTLPTQSANVYNPSSHIHLLTATDIGSHAMLITVNTNVGDITITTPLASASDHQMHDAEVLPIRLRTTPKLIRQSQYFRNITATVPQLKGNPFMRSIYHYSIES